MKYISHKTVDAFEIIKVEHIDGALRFVLDGRAPLELVGYDKMIARYEPKVGDYFIVYADGYQSFSPRAAFLDGYKLIDDRSFRDIKAGINLRDGPAGNNA